MVISKKYDGGKNRWDLLPVECVEEIVSVLTHGSKKYADNGWQSLPNLQNRYYAAALRHIVAWRKGTKMDHESKLHHLAHACACLIFCMWKDRKRN